MYPDAKIMSLQTEYLEKHWQKSLSDKFEITQLSQDKGGLEQELNLMQANFDDAMRKGEEDVLHEREKMKQFQHQAAKEEESHRERQYHQEQEASALKRELEHLKARIRESQDNHEELEAQMQLLIGQYDSLKEENREL